MGQLASDLEVSDRSFRRWANGTAEIPENIWRELSAKLVERKNDISRILND